MTQVLLVTCERMPDGEEWTGTTYLIDAFTARGIDARWVAWTDPDVDWRAAEVVAIRSTWDYFDRREEFLDWARSVGPRLLNGHEALVWNTDKSYLVELAAAGVPVVPTVVVTAPADLPDAIAGFGEAVVKPSVGGGGVGVVVVRAGQDVSERTDLGPGPWVVQPLVESVRTEGETSVFVLGGLAVAQASKKTAGDEIRVHEKYGGATYATDLTDEAQAIALATVQAAADRLGRPLDYARVDLMRLGDGRLAVSELEATEPGLYLEVIPGNAEAFVDLVAPMLA